MSVDDVRLFFRVAMKSGNRFIRCLGMGGIFCLLAGAAVVPWPAVAAAGYPERIVSLAPNITEILYDLGMESRIAAVTDYCDYPPAAARKPRVGGFANPSLESIVAQRPDCVVMTEDGNPRILDRRLKALGIRTYVFKARRIQDLPREIRAMGLTLGAGPAADRRADWIEKQIRRIAEKSSTASPGRIRKALFIFQPVPLIAAGKGTTVDDAFAILGVCNIAAMGTTRYPKYSLEEIIRHRPDVLFFGKGRGMQERIKPLMERLSTLEAVRSGRVFFVGDAILRLGPRIAAGLEEMAACLDVR
jgi:iron complex transport system substrate-binding protein